MAGSLEAHHTTGLVVFVISVQYSVLSVHKMSSTTLTFLLLASFSAATLAATVGKRDSYENLPQQIDDFDSVEDNLVEDEYYSIPGLYPPKETANDYYNVKYEGAPPQEEETSTPLQSKYVIDTVNKVLRLKNEDATAETPLSQREEDEIKKMTAAFVGIFTGAKLEDVNWDSLVQSATQSDSEASTEEVEDFWKSLKPVITLSKDGVSISFENNGTQENTTNTTEGSTAQNTTGDSTEQAPAPAADVEDSDELKESLWGFLSKSIDKLLEEELERVGNNTDDESRLDTDQIYFTTTEDAVATESDDSELSRQDQSAITKFVDSIWNLMRTSVEYVGGLFNSKSAKDVEVSEEPETTTDTTEVPEVPSTTAKPSTTEGLTKTVKSSTTLFAFEEPSSHHRFPSQEFEKGRDIDALLYGHGIV